MRTIAFTGLGTALLVVSVMVWSPARTTPAMSLVYDVPDIVDIGTPHSELDPMERAITRAAEIYFAHVRAERARLRWRLLAVLVGPVVLGFTVPLLQRRNNKTT